MKCFKCQSETKKGYTYNKTFYCDDCYENVLRHEALDAYNKDPKIVSTKMRKREQTIPKCAYEQGYAPFQQRI